MGLPGIRDQHAGCVGAYLVERDLFDFLLLSLPDNDTHSHKNGPHAQVTSIANADRQLERRIDLRITALMGFNDGCFGTLLHHDQRTHECRTGLFATGRENQIDRPFRCGAGGNPNHGTIAHQSGV